MKKDQTIEEILEGIFSYNCSTVEVEKSIEKIIKRIRSAKRKEDNKTVKKLYYRAVEAFAAREWYGTAVKIAREAGYKDDEERYKRLEDNLSRRLRIESAGLSLKDYRCPSYKGLDPLDRTDWGHGDSEHW